MRSAASGALWQLRDKEVQELVPVSKTTPSIIQEQEQQQQQQQPVQQPKQHVHQEEPRSKPVSSQFNHWMSFEVNTIMKNGIYSLQFVLYEYEYNEGVMLQLLVS